MKKPLSLPQLIGCALLTVFSFGALCLSFEGAPGAEAVRLLPFGGIWALGLAALFLLYRAWLWQEKPFSHVLLWLLAALFAGILTLAPSFAARGNTQLLTENKLAMAKALLFFAGRVPLLYAAMVLLQRVLACPCAVSLPSESSALLSSRWLWPGLTAALLLCWLPYYVCIYPGVVSNDSITQLKELFGVVPLSNGNPIFQTFLVWLCVQAGALLGGPDGAVALYCIGQALFMALLLAYLVALMARSRAPLWLVALSFCFYALCPIFPLFAFCVGKDTNFAMAVLFFSLMVWRVLSAPAFSLRRLLALCLSAALVLLLRNPGIYLVSLTLLLLLLWRLVKQKKVWATPVIALAFTACLWATLHLLVLPSLHALPMPETEEYSLPLQQIARVVASQPETITPEQKAIIDAVLPYDQLQPHYNGELSDPVKLLWKTSAPPQQKQAFFALWLQLAPSHASTYFSATFHNNYGYLCPGYLSTIKPTLLIGKQGRTTDIDSFFSFAVNPRSHTLQAAMNVLTRNPLGRIALSPGLYGWLCLFACCVLLASRQKQLLICAVPAAFTLAGCLLSAVNGYFRYAMPLYFAAPLLLFFCSQALRPAASLTPSKEA